MLHALRAHLQVLLWKAADKLDPPQITQDITKFGWDITDGVMPVIATQPVGPQLLLDVVSCTCTSESSACAHKSCGCHNQRVSCTEYCACAGSDACHNPYTSNEEEEEEIDEDADEDDE